MDSDLKHWITSLLTSGYPQDQLLPLLLKSGFSRKDVEKEMEHAAPYISALTKVRHKLALREGVLKSLDQQMRSVPHYLNIKKVPLPPFEQFLEEYFYPNRVGLFSNALEHSAVRHWTPRTLIDKIGADTMIEIQAGRDKASNHYDYSFENFAQKMRFADYVEKMEKTQSSNDFYMVGNNYYFNRDVFMPLREEIGDLGGYLTPEDGGRNRMYFWIGPQGTITPLHYDNWNSILLQVYGKKLFRLVPALQGIYMYNDRSLRFSEVDPLNPDLASYPEFSNVTMIDVEVGPGEALFVPMGWWHHVTSLSPSISVGCGNLNAGRDYKIYMK